MDAEIPLSVAVQSIPLEFQDMYDIVSVSLDYHHTA
jgi:hypothetical protein